MRSPLMRRLRAIEASRGQKAARQPADMTDNELWRALDIRDPATGALRKDLTNDELDECIRKGG